MGKLRFSIPKTIVGGLTDTARLSDDESPLDGLVESVIQDLSTDVMVTVSSVTMHLAAWQDPDGWGDDWREVAGDEDVDTFIANLLAGAIEES